MFYAFSEGFILIQLIYESNWNFIDFRDTEESIWYLYLYIYLLIFNLLDPYSVSLPKLSSA